MSVREYLASIGATGKVSKLSNGNGAFIGYTVNNEQFTMPVGSGINSQKADLSELSIAHSTDEKTGKPMVIACASSLTVLDSFVM